MKQVDIRYLDPAVAKTRLAVHPIDEMRAKRDLAGEVWADAESVLYYQSFHAAKRAGLAPAAQPFDEWLAGVESVELILSRQQVTDALAAKAVTKEQADFMLAKIAEQEAELAGGSAAPPS